MLRNLMPNKINNVLFGNRSKYGTKIVQNDTDWKNWLLFYEKFYFNTQKKGIGKYINNAGYRVLKKIDFENKNILELGPGSLPHKHYWKNKPKSYVGIDTNKNFLDITKNTVECEFKGFVIYNENLPNFKSENFDIVLCFYSLEHIHKIDSIIDYFYNILKKDGLLVGAIPNEGGIFWGIGRQLTSKKFAKEYGNFNFNKIICWEHPNFCDEIIKKILKSGFKKMYKTSFPLRYLPFYDLNLITSFIFKKM